MSPPPGAALRHGEFEAKHPADLQHRARLVAKPPVQRRRAEPTNEMPPAPMSVRLQTPTRDAPPGWEHGRQHGGLPPANQLRQPGGDSRPETASALECAVQASTSTSMMPPHTSPESAAASAVRST